MLSGGKKISPEKKIIYRIALALYFLVLGYTVYGFVYEKSDYKIQKVDLTFNDLPKSFDGFTIAQISDLHLGSFTNPKTLEKAFSMTKNLHPDVLFITGDLINVSYEEFLPYIPYFNSINPPFGKFSILGNHDIGDYFSLEHPDNQEWLTEKLIETERQVGFQLLIDSSCFIKKGNDSIAIIGVNNCGSFPFKHSGNLKKAMQKTNVSDFKILLSHDPDQWQKEVTEKTNIDFTLSGHTHAMQLAIICGNIRLSPSEIRYKNWYGLYNKGKQYLYVNPGLGFSGFSGRIGIRPEITMITLHCSN
jgi:predicted MPP superfamily phosphohydrolase